jgi:hypothetical protein
MSRNIFLPILLLLAALPFAATAEEAPPIQLVSAFNITIKPIARPAFEKLLERSAEANRQLNTQRYYTTWIRQYGAPNQITVVRNYDSWKAMDEAPMDPLTKALGEEEATALRAVFDHVQSVQSGVWIHRPDLSSGVDPEGPPGRNMWLQVSVVPGMNARAEAYIAKVAEATRKVAPEVTYQAYAPVVGEPNFYVFTVPSSYERLDQGPAMTVPARLEKAFGKREADQLEAERAAVVADQSMVMVNARADLSYWPEAE